MTSHPPARPLQRPLAIVLTIAAVLWTAAIFLTALAARRPSSHLPAAAMYAAAGLVCHQQPARSFHLEGVKLPVCARCTGLYVSGAAGALLAWFGLARVPRRIRRYLLLAAIPTAATLVLEWLQLVAPGNAARALAALPLGGLAGWTCVRLLRAEGREAHAL